MEVPSISASMRTPWPEPYKIYAAMVTRLDTYVGEILEELDRLGLASNTLVFFTSDNGPLKRGPNLFPGFGRRPRGAKATLYEGGLRVPMIARWPGVVPEGTGPSGALDVRGCLSHPARGGGAICPGRTRWDQCSPDPAG